MFESAVYTDFFGIPMIAMDYTGTVDVYKRQVEDVIVVCMEQEPEWVVSQRKQDDRISSVEELSLIHI